jgi:hypothetical protein
VARSPFQGPEALPFHSRGEASFFGQLRDQLSEE